MRHSWVPSFVAIVAIACTIVLGTTWRLADPLSSPVIPAEDPYTHMALVQQHMRTGDLDPLTPGGGIYPPGLHAYIAAVWSFTGADLYEIMRLGPAIFGGIGILCLAVLLWRHAGPAAAFLGALGLAVLPEAIFRTGMMSPTAQDLALLPLLLLSLLEVVKGRMAWIGVAAPTSLFLVFAHPWLLVILAITGACFAVLSFLLPWDATSRDRIPARGMAAALAIIGGSMGLALTSCGGRCGPGVLDLVPRLAEYAWLGWVIAAASIVPIAILAQARFANTPYPALRRGPNTRWPLRAAASLALLGTLVGITWLATKQGFPEHVDLPRMIGWPLLLLAAGALCSLPFSRNRLLHLGAALVVATYPFVIFNPLESPFWPHRTAVFLAVGVVVLAGIAGATLFMAASRWLAENPSSRARLAAVRLRPAAATLVGAFLVIACAGAVYAGTPETYPGGWYRLYPPCELEALRDVSDTITASPNATIIVGGWQPKLVLAALTGEPDRIWFSAGFFTDPAEEEKIRGATTDQGRPLIAVVDRHLVAEHPGANLSNFEQSSWKPLGAWCSGQGTGEPRVLAYEREAFA